MFFFGAFSGNLLYLILAISSLAGYSAMVLHSSDSQSNISEDHQLTSSHISYINQLPEISASYYSDVTDHVNQILNEETALQAPLVHFFVAIYIPPLIPDKSHFSGSPLFSRPPPIVLV